MQDNINPIQIEKEFSTANLLVAAIFGGVSIPFICFWLVVLLFELTYLFWLTLVISTLLAMTFSYLVVFSANKNSGKVYAHKCAATFAISGLVVVIVIILLGYYVIQNIDFTSF